MFQGWWVVGTHFVAQLFIVGFFTYAFPLLFEPVLAEFETDTQTINYLPSLGGAIGLGAAPLAGPFVDKWSARGLMLIGAVCMVLGLLGMAASQSIFQFVLAGGIFLGIANILLGPMAGSAVVSRWFTATRGRALGIAAIGTSIGGMLMPAVLGNAIATTGWRGGLNTIAIAAGVIVIPLLLFRFWDRPSDRGLEAEPMPFEGTHAPPPKVDELTTNKVILKRPEFWFFTSSLALLLVCYTATLANMGQFHSDLGVEGADSARFFSLLALVGIGGKLAFGYLADRIPLKAGLAAAISLTALSMIIFSLEPSYAVLLMGGVTMGLATGGILPVWNAMVPAIFGVANYGRTMGLMSPVIGIAVTPSYPLVGAIRDATGSYVLAFQICVGLLILSGLLLVPLRVPSREAAG